MHVGGRVTDAFSQFIVFVTKTVAMTWKTASNKNGFFANFNCMYVPVFFNGNGEIAMIHFTFVIKFLAKDSQNEFLLNIIEKGVYYKPRYQDMYSYAYSINWYDTDVLRFR